MEQEHSTPYLISISYSLGYTSSPRHSHAIVYRYEAFSLIDASFSKHHPNSPIAKSTSLPGFVLRSVTMIVWVLDPDIKGLSDALWFTFQTGTTIGYGDLIVNNTFARAVTVFFSIYSMALVAVFTGILAGYFVEIIKSEAKASAVKFLLDLERLPEMTHDELVELSDRARKFARKEWEP